MAEPTSELAAELVIDDVEQLKVLSDALRLQLLDVLSDEAERGATAKELAEALGTKQTKLYRHLALLEEHGFIRVVETRLVSGILEKRYGDGPATASTVAVRRRGQGAGAQRRHRRHVRQGPQRDPRPESTPGHRCHCAGAERERMALWATTPACPRAASAPSCA